MTEFREEMLCNWILAAGTILLSLTALFGGWIRMLLSVPILRIKLKEEKEEVNQPIEGGECYYYHLLIWNKRRRAPAHDVKVHLNSIYRPDAEGKMRRKSFAGPVQLAWQYWQHETFETEKIVGREETCDLGRLRKNGSIFLLSLLSEHKLTKEMLSNNKFTSFEELNATKNSVSSVPFDSTLRAGQKMRVGIVVSAYECDSKELLLEISYDGGWGPDAIKIRQVPALSLGIERMKGWLWHHVKKILKEKQKPQTGP
jgi:hypothetical protein